MEPPTYLANKYPHERDSHIHFDEGPHIYTIDGDSDYMSVQHGIILILPTLIRMLLLKK